MEQQRRDQYNQQRKNELIALEQLGEKLCKEQMKLMHQIEHINWHIGRAHPHDIATPIEHPPAYPKSCHSSALVGHHGHTKSQCSGKPSATVVNLYNMPLNFIYRSCIIFITWIASMWMKNETEIFCLHQGYLQISAERFIKTIAELRRKICMTKQSLEQEIERKRCAEKNLTELRREVSKQKKMMSMRRCVPLPAITSVKKCVKWTRSKPIIIIIMTIIIEIVFRYTHTHTA